MSKDKEVQITIRGMNKLTKHQLRQRISWMKKKVRQLEKLASGLWLVTRKDYASNYNFSLMSK